MRIMMDENERPDPDETQGGMSPYTPIEIKPLARDASAAPPTAPAPREKKRRTVSVGAVAVIAALCIVATFMTTYVLLSVWYTQGGTGTVNQAVEKMELLDALVRQDYVGEIDEETLTDWILKGYMAGLGDPYAGYYTKEEFSALMADNSGEMQGIGISVNMDTETGLIDIVSVFPNSPALEAGVMPGDRIAYIIEGEQYYSVVEIGYDAAVSMLQGEADTYASFVVQRGQTQEEMQKLTFSIKRGYITEYTVTSRLYAPDPTVGVIRITSFDGGTPNQFTDAVQSLQSAGATRLILDVRYNPGGDLNSVCSVLDALLPQGPVIRTIDKNGNEETVYESDANELDIPMVVLVNEGTASAGELFASALQDYEKAPVVGVQTYGKGSMQTIRGFGDGTGFKYTYRYYCPPFSDNFDGVGVTPDIVAELDASLEGKNIYKITDEEDNQLRAAYNALPDA